MQEHSTQGIAPWMVFTPMLAFAGLAVLMLLGVTQAWDELLLLALRPDGPAMPFAAGWLLPALRVLTEAGDVPVLTVVAVTTVLVSLLRRRTRDALFMALCTLGGVVLMLATKEFLARPRPGVVTALAEVSTLSFPSGHALMSVAVYLPLALLLLDSDRLRAMKHGPWLVAVPLIVGLLLIAFSRLYLGVHYPTDVLAGWGLGLAWVLLWTKWWHGMPSAEGTSD